MVTRAATHGTKVVVYNLFNDEPVRQKYCQEDKTNVKRIKEVEELPSP